MMNAEANVIGYDSVVKCEAIVAAGATPVETLNKGIDQSDARAFMTNHAEFTSMTTEMLIERVRLGILFAYGRGMFDKREFEAAGINYLGAGFG